MNKKEISKLIVEYEDIILDFSHLMKWLLKKQKTVGYRMAVWQSIHEKTIQRLESAHQHLEDAATGQRGD
ncbi:MAG: hypothetical protein KKF44_11585 [Nanoarchaeota archaeon]|nr:hypothetical protein [Nanoarchaeota archaeon]